MRTTTGVRKSDMINVPMKPMRRWVPQSPTRTQNAIYKIKPIEKPISP